MRALLNYGASYPQEANRNIIALAMIETEEAFNNLDDILSVPNFSGVYIGPADMSLSHGLQPKFDVKDDSVFSNIKLIAKKAKEYNKIAGIHNGTIEYAIEMIELGYKFVTISSDYRSMTTYAQSIVNKLKNLNQSKEEKTY